MRCVFVFLFDTLKGGYLQTSQGRINQYLADLEKDGFIKIFRREVPSGIACYYQLGHWEGSPGKTSYKEIIWLDEHFSQLIQIKKEEKERKEKELYDAISKDFDRLGVV